MADARQHSRNTILKKLTVFESLHQHAVARFCKENLYNLLRFVTNWAQADDNATSKQTRKISFKLRSVRQLTDLVAAIRRKKAPTKVTYDPTLQHCDRFLNDLMHMKDLYKYFNDEIYQCLLTNHYDPSTRRTVTSSSSKTTPHVAEDDDSGIGSQVETDELSRLSGNSSKQRNGKVLLSHHGTVNGQSDSEKRYTAIVNELQNMVKSWKGLLSEDELDLNNFDPESYHELMEFVSYSQFEIILRLVPDMFLKCKKCIVLANAWLNEADTGLADNHRHVLPIVMETPPTPKDENRETAGSSNHNGETPVSTNRNRETPLSFLHNRQTPSSLNHNRDTPLSTDIDKETPLSPNNNSNKNNRSRRQVPVTRNNNSRMSTSRNTNTGRSSSLREVRGMPNSDRATRMPTHDIEVLSPNNNTGHLSVNKFEKEITEIKDHVSDIEKSIDEEEKEIAKYRDEMENLHNRDAHFDNVSSDFSKLDSRLTATASEYHKLKTNQLSVTSKLRSCSKSSPRYSDLKEQSRRLDSAVAQLHWDMKLLEYERAMVQEDYLVEMEVRPSFIRFQGDIQERLGEAQQALHTNQEDKLQLEKQIELLRTNSDRMRKKRDPYPVNEDPADRYRGHGYPSNGVNNGDSSVSTTPSSVEFDDLDFEFSDVFVEDGNEADTDSIAPYDMSPRNAYARKSRAGTKGGIMKPQSVMSEKTGTVIQDTPSRKPRPNSFHTADFAQSENIYSNNTGKRMSLSNWNMQPYVNVLAQTHGRRSSGPRQGRQQLLSDKTRQAWAR